MKFWKVILPTLAISAIVFAQAAQVRGRGPTVPAAGGVTSPLNVAVGSIGILDAGTIILDFPNGNVCSATNCAGRNISFDGDYWTFNTSLKANNEIYMGYTTLFRTDTLPTCSSGSASPAVFKVTLGGSGAKTKACMCTYDGTTAAWQNVITGGIGTTTTCPASEISVTGDIDFGNITPATCADGTKTLTGAAVNDPLKCSYPADILTGLVPYCFVSSANTVTFRICNITDVVGGTAMNLDAGTFAASK